MELEMRLKLVREPFEEKIREVEQLIQLSLKLKAARMGQAVGYSGIQRDPLIIAAIRRKLVLSFSYNGKRRTVEPQTYGLSTTGREILRAYERSAPSGAERSGMAKLFDLEKISGLRETGQTFQEAFPAHNPNDSAMVEIFATLPVSQVT